VSIQEEGQGRQLWLYDVARDTLTKFAFEGTVNSGSTWTPDGTHVAFSSNRDGLRNLFWQRADGSGGLERLTTSQYVQSPRSFDLTGQLLAFLEIHPTSGFDIWVLRLSDRTAQPFLRTPFNESSPSFSPDGHWLAYVSDESGRWEVYVQPYPGPGGKWPISQDGGTEPVWNPNGKELFYRSGNKLMAVEVTTQFGFATSKPRTLFQGPYTSTGATLPFYDVSPDGQRFLMLKGSDQAASMNQIVVVQNWFTELQQRVPTR
jgi:serine/threonine-protein kinase